MLKEGSTEHMEPPLPWGWEYSPILTIWGLSAEQGMVFQAACHKQGMQFKSISNFLGSLLSYSGYLLFFK